MASSINDIVEKITEYIQVKTELIKLKIIGQISRLLANVLALGFIAMIAFFFLFFLSFGFGSYLNTVLDSNFFGHLIVAGCYLLLMLVIFLLMKSGKIQGWIENLILTITEQDEHED